MLAKKSGIYLVVPLVLLSTPVLRGLRRRWLVAGAAAVVAYLVIHAGLMAAFHVEPGSEAEAYSLPSQQIARVVRDDGAALSAEDHAAIERYYPGTNLGEVYRPRLADPVKGALDTQALDADRPGYLGLWLRLGVEYPQAWGDAALAATSGYWYPGTTYLQVRAEDWTVQVSRYSVADDVPRDAIDPNVSSCADPPAYRTAMASAVNSWLRVLPVPGWLQSLGLWFWACVVLAVMAWLRHRAEAVPVVVLAGMVWVTCMVSPVYAEARYAYPLLLLVPVLAATVLGGRAARAWAPAST